MFRCKIDAREHLIWSNFHFSIEALFTFCVSCDIKETTINSTKMKVSKFLPMILFLGVLSFSSCNDDDDEDPTPPTKTELLTAKNWMVEGWNVEPAIDIDGNGTQENNLIPYIDACNLDDFFDFNSDGSYTIEEGASKCDPNDPSVVESGDWLWNSDNTRLIFEPNGEANREADVISIKSSEVIVEIKTVIEGVTYTETQTWN